MDAEAHDGIGENDVVGLGLAFPTPPCVVIVEPRSFIRECMALSLQKKLALPILAYSSVESWSKDPAGFWAGVFILSGSEREIEAAQAEITHAAASGQRTAPVVVLSETLNLDHMRQAVRNGAKGYIPSNTPLEVAARAIRRVLSGGDFLPAQAAEEVWAPVRDAPVRKEATPDFTARENDVVRALLKGRSNKAIAYELGMSASSVKAHVRNVMRKLQVRNRTEAVVKITGMGARP